VQVLPFHLPNIHININLPSAI